MIDRAPPTLSISRQCHLLEVSRASVYRRPAPVRVCEFLPVAVTAAI
jgi:hypothetical protein